MNNQSAFEKMVKHLEKQQWKRSENTNEEGDTTCAYRGEDGKMCAVGCLIPDEEYQVSFDEGEGLNVSGIIDDVVVLGEISESLLNAMQRFHDNKMSVYNEATNKWCINVIAERFKLNTDFLKDVKFRC